MKRIEFIKGLREVADFFENHPGITIVPNPYLFATIWTSDKIDPKPILAAFAKGSGDAKKIYTETEVQVEATIGGFAIRYVAPRGLVCRRVVVGTKVTPEFTLPARGEIMVPEKVEEIIKWECPDSLLASAK